MADPTLNEVRLLAEAVLALAKAVREGPPPTYNLDVALPELPITVNVPSADHPVAVTVVERERDDSPPTVTVPVTVAPAPAAAPQVHVAAPSVTVEAPAQAAAPPPPLEWEVIYEVVGGQRRIAGFRAR